MIKKTIIISILTFHQLLLTFFYQIFLLNIFGVGADLDIYFASNTINYIILAIASGSINAVITPIFVKHYKNNNLKELGELASSTFNLIFLLFFLFGSIQYFFARQIVESILPGFSNGNLEIVIDLFKIQAFLSIITILTALLSALHYTFNNFYITIIYPTIGQLFQILFVWIYHKDLGLYALVYSLIINQFLSFLLLSIHFLKFYKFKIIYNDDLKRSNNKILPLILSSSFSKSNILVDRFFGSTLSSGSITLLQYGEKIIGLISGFLNKGVSLVSLRNFSMEHDNKEEFQRLFYFIYKTMVFFVVPVSFCIIFFIKDILNLLLLSNKFSNEDINQISLVVISFIGIFIGGSINSSIINAFYAKGLTKIVSTSNVILQIFGISLKIGLFYLLGFWGLPIAISISSLAGAVYFFILYNKYIYGFDKQILIFYLLKIIFISFLSIIIPISLTNLLIDSVIIRLCLSLLLFIFTFIILVSKFEKEVFKVLLISFKFKT